MLKQINDIISRKYFHVIVYSVLSLAIVGNFFPTGYVLTLDMIFTPEFHYTTVYYGLGGSIYEIPRIPFIYLIQIANLIVSMQVIQKISLFLTFFLAGVSAHSISPSDSRLGKYFTGILYVINPYVYARLLAGQWMILLAYSIVPYAIKSFSWYLENQNKKTISIMIFLLTTVAAINLHTLFLLLTLYLILFIFKSIDKRERDHFIPLLRSTVWASGLFFLLNFYWIFPIITAESTVINQINSADIMAFAPRPASNFNIAFTIASMYGFWRGGYIYTKDLFSYWYLFFFFILFLVVHGSLTTLGDKKKGATTRAFVTVAIVALILGIGASSDSTAPIFNYLFENLPIFKGFRDSHKFVALLVFAYAYLGGLGVDDFAKQIKMKQDGRKMYQIISIIIIVVALITPLIYTHTIFGFHDQLKPVDYPESWYEVNDLINDDEAEFNILFLPWHAYMDFQWLENQDKRLGNPADSFFDKAVISGDNMEVGGVYSQSADPISKYIEFLLKNRNDITNFGEMVAPVNVKYIILAEEVDYKDYDFLYRQEDLKLFFEGDGLVVFKNKHETAKVYEVNTTRYIKDYEELLVASKEEDITSALYLIGDQDGLDGHIVRRTLNYTMRSPAYYELEDPKLKYVIFTTSQLIDSDHWDMDGRPMIKNMGLTPAFVNEEGMENNIVFTRFYITYLPGYIISFGTFVALITLYYQNRDEEEKMI